MSDLPKNYNVIMVKYTSHTTPLTSKRQVTLSYLYAQGKELSIGT